PKRSTVREAAMAGRNNRKRAPHDAEKRTAPGRPSSKLNIDSPTRARSDHGDFDQPGEFRSDNVANTNAKKATTNKIVGALLMVVSIICWIGREFIKTMVFEGVVRIWHSNPPIDLMALIEYGPPVVFALLAIYFLALPNLLASISRHPPADGAQSP